METETNKLTVPLSSWDEFRTKLAKLNKRAAKLGCEPVSYTVLKEENVKRYHTFKDADGEHTKEYLIPARIIALNGTAPKLEGFEFIARIEYLSDGKSTLFHTVPGTETKIDERFRKLTPAVCEHCHKIRRRNDTFVVREIATGKQTQVGRQCLADFTGIHSVKELLARASWLNSFSDLREEGERWWSGHFAERLDTVRVLALTSAYIGQHGWTPKSAETFGKLATAHEVAEHFYISSTRDKEYREYMAKMSAMAKAPEHQERAAKVIAWIKDELSLKAKSDYEHNLVTLVANDLIERKHLGIVCSAVAAYQRAMNLKVEYAKRQSDMATSAFVGEVGKRLRNVNVKVFQVRALEAGAWGPRTLVKFIDENNNLFTWFASSDRDYEVGDRYVLDGTVKKHNEYKGIKETQLTRVNLGV